MQGPLPSEYLVVVPRRAPPGMRFVLSGSSALFLAVAPWSQAAAVEPLLASAGCAAYILIGGVGGAEAEARPAPPAGPPVYVGRADDAGRRLLRHEVEPPFPGIHTIVVVLGRDAGVLGRDLSEAVEGLLSQRIAGLRRYQVRNRYQIPPLRSSQLTDLRRWLSDLRDLFSAAGLPLLHPQRNGNRRTRRRACREQRGANGHPKVQASGSPETAAARDQSVAGTERAVRTGYRTDIPAGFGTSGNARVYDLSDRELVARAVVEGDWVVIEAGALARRSEVRWNQTCLTAKRRRLVTEGLLRPLRRRPHLLKLRAPIAVSSLVNAARLLRGDNADDRVWQRVR
ncbi:hypothetical protein [Methylobacterium hispanicum]|uniref:hypothetical protein n=1 Tax=Methylobacterium hispanicum TaxID=270350 RepID=UPI002F30E5A3